MDWHAPWPADNGGHFSENPDYLDSWPVHCEAGSHGAALHEDIDTLVWSRGLRSGQNVFTKGYGKPDYSGFQGHNGSGVFLDTYLKEAGIGMVHVVGIAGDYCVLQTALDAIRKGYKTDILPNMVASVGGEAATRAVEAQIYEAQGL